MKKLFKLSDKLEKYIKNKNIKAVLKELKGLKRNAKDKTQKKNIKEIIK